MGMDISENKLLEGSLMSDEREKIRSKGCFTWLVRPDTGPSSEIGVGS